jgi:hypothetical protein
MIYLIERLHVDSLENWLSEALTWHVIGYTTSKEMTEKYAAAEVVHGDGHPIDVGKTMPRYRFKEVQELTIPPDVWKAA